MALAIHSQSLLSAGERATSCSEFRWYAAHVRANHERRVAEQLAQRSVEFILPLYESVRQWKDRRIKLQLPLFPGYVLEDAEIDVLRGKLNGPVRAEPHPFLQIGRRVRVKRGPLEGFEGFLVRQKQKYRVVLSIDTIMRSIAAEVDLADVEFISSGPRVPAQAPTSGMHFPARNS
ncbi:MAG: transcription termination/antitermination NusG family protein [Candidatus Acidiferrales bacterium]